MACDVLKFLDASPHSLFNADGSGEPGAGAAEEDAFLSFLSCVVSVNSTVRRLATGVAKRLLSDSTILDTIKSRSRLKSLGLRREFWRRW